MPSSPLWLAVFAINAAPPALTKMPSARLSCTELRPHARGRALREADAVRAAEHHEVAGRPRCRARSRLSRMPASRLPDTELSSMRLAAPPRVTAMPRACSRPACSPGPRSRSRRRTATSPGPPLAYTVLRATRHSRGAGEQDARLPVVRSPCCARSRARGSGTPRSRRRGAVRPGCRRCGTGSLRRRRCRDRSRCRSPVALHPAFARPQHDSAGRVASHLQP